MRKQSENMKHETEIFSRVFPDLIERLAKWVEKKTSNYSKTKALVLFSIFCMASTILLLGIATGGFYSTDKIDCKIKILKQGKVNPDSEQKIIPSRDEVLRRLERGRKYLDSLARTPALKEKFDSLIWARPGLLDSLKQAEDYYKN